MNTIKFKQSLFYVSISALVLFICTPFIEQYLGESKNLEWFRDIKASFKLDFIVLLVLAIYSSIRVANCKYDTPNNAATYVITFFTVVYSYERFVNVYFEFLPFQINNFSQQSVQIMYLDSLYLVVILHFALYLKELMPKKDLTVKNQLFEDKPIEGNDDDGLNGLFDIPADKIIKVIEKNMFQNSLTIGLNGEWGSGKTSVFNNVRNRLSNLDNITVIEFNPWMGFDKKVLVKDFFNALSEALGENFSVDLSHYANEIIDNGDSNIVVKTFQSLILKKEKSLETIFSDINRKIDFLGKKIVVFIDDVDRLDKEEIFEVLKLIRKTANFKHMFFVLAYDRTYVNNSIKDQSGVTIIKYLDKIINVEIGLPYYDKNILKNYFVKLLRLVVPEELQYKVDYFVESYEKTEFILDLELEKEDLFVYWMSNFREIKKVVNAIEINYSEIYRQVNFVDVVHLEILKLKHPQLYGYLYTKREELLAIHRDTECYFLLPSEGSKLNLNHLNGPKGKYDMPSLKFKNSSEVEKKETNFDIYLNQYVKENNINAIEKEKILLLVEQMFRRWDGNFWFSDSIQSKEQELSVKFVNKFERYFSHTVFGSHFREDEFDRFIQSNIESLKDRIDIVISKGQLKELCFRLNNISSFTSEIEYVNILTAAMMLLDQPKHLIDEDQLIGKMFDIEFLKIFYDWQSAKDFFINLFTNVQNKSLISCKILTKLNDRNLRRHEEDFTKFPLNQTEINLIFEQYILVEIENGELFTAFFWRLYLMSLKLVTTGSRVPFESANVLINQKLSDPNLAVKFLKSLVLYEDYGTQSILRKEIILKLFGAFENFQNEFLNDLDDNLDNDYVEQFKLYYDKSKSNNWNYIEFSIDFIEKSISFD